MHQRSSSSSLFCVFRSFYAPNPEEWEWQSELALLNSDRMREKIEDKIKLILTTLPPDIFILWLSFNLSVIHFQFAYISPYQHCGQFCYCNWWSVVSFFSTSYSRFDWGWPSAYSPFASCKGSTNDLNRPLPLTNTAKWWQRHPKSIIMIIA